MAAVRELRIFPLTVLGFGVLLACGACGTIETNNTVRRSDERRLVADLLKRYREYGKEARPLENSSKPLDVQFGLRLMHLEVDEKHQTLKTSVWKRVRWWDELLIWNPEEYGNLNHTILPLAEIWRPDIDLVNTASTMAEARQVHAQVKHTGRVFWAPQQVYSSACLIDLTNFPYDQHTCDMWFQCTANYYWFVNPMPYTKSPMDISTHLPDYKNAAEWEILDNTTERVTRPRDSGVILMYSNRVSLRFSLTVRRRPGFNVLLLMLPCVVLSLLTPVVFSLPPDRPDRHMLVMSLFGSFMVLLLIVTETAPSSAASVPKLGTYYQHNLLLIISSLFVSAWIVNIYKFGEQRAPVPRWVKVLFFDLLSIPLMMRDRARILSNASTDEIMTRPSVGGCAVHENNLGKAKMSSTSILMCNMAAAHQRQPEEDDWQRHTASNVEQRLRHLETIAFCTRTSATWAMQWKLVAALLDRLFMIVYLVLSISFIVFFYPVPPS